MASFSMNCSLNSHNCQHWAYHNPDWFEKAHTQCSQKLNPLAGIILSNVFIGLFYINKALNGPLVTSNIRNDRKRHPHFIYLPVRVYLNNKFPGLGYGVASMASGTRFFLRGCTLMIRYFWESLTIEEYCDKYIYICTSIMPEILAYVENAIISLIFLMAISNI